MSVSSIPTFASAPTIKGQPFVSNTLQAVPNAGPQPINEIDYDWSNGMHTTNNPYLQLMDSDLGNMISCSVTLRSAAGTVTEETAVVGPVTVGPITAPQVPTIDASADHRPKEFNFEVYHGDTWSLPFQLRDDAITAHDLTNSTMTSDVVDNAGNKTVLTVTIGVNPITTKTDPTMGAILLGPPTAGPLTPGIYSYDVQEVTTAGTTTWARGELEVTGDVTP